MDRDTLHEQVPGRRRETAAAFVTRQFAAVAAAHNGRKLPTIAEVEAFMTASAVEQLPVEKA